MLNNQVWGNIFKYHCDKIVGELTNQINQIGKYYWREEKELGLESPLEKAFLLAFLAKKFLSNSFDSFIFINHENPDENLHKLLKRNDYNNIYLLYPQRKISKYRVDFLLGKVSYLPFLAQNINYCFSSPTLQHCVSRLEEKWDSSNPIYDLFCIESIAIEIDGYEYHKSSEQFTNDRKKDRDLKLLGYDVFRFAGEEIFKTPSECLEQCFDFLDSEHGKRYQANAVNQQEEASKLSEFIDSIYLAN